MRERNLPSGFNIFKESFIFRNHFIQDRLMSNTLEKVIHILVEKIGIAPTEATTDANFIKDLGIDSLDYAEIVMEFEQTFDIRIPDSDAERLQTVGQAVEYIDEKILAKP